MLTGPMQLHHLVCAGNFVTWLEHLTSDTIIPVLFYPFDEPFFQTHPHWAEDALNVSMCPTEFAGCRRHKTGRGQAVLTCEVDLKVPTRFGANISAARTHFPNTFCGKPNHFSAEYVVGTKWFSFPMFLEPVMGHFDFWLKIDVDVCFLSAVRDDIIAPLVTNRAIFFHSHHTQENPVCEATLGEFMQLYARSMRAKACSDTREPPWPAWGQPNAYPTVAFSNFVGGWLGFWQSPAVLHFARLWWEWDGGWSYRWSDQQFWIAALWMMNRNDSASVVDLTAWRATRNPRFRHSKAFFACSENPLQRSQSNMVARPSQERQQMARCRKQVFTGVLHEVLRGQTPLVAQSFT